MPAEVLSTGTKQDGFYYDVLKRPDGSTDYLRTRSISGLIPLLAVSIALHADDSVKAIPSSRCWPTPSPNLEKNGEHLSTPSATLDRGITIVFCSPSFRQTRLRRILERVFDEEEFLSPYGIRSLSKIYENHPYSYQQGE